MFMSRQFYISYTGKTDASNYEAHVHLKYHSFEPPGREISNFKSFAVWLQSLYFLRLLKWITFRMSQQFTMLKRIQYFTYFRQGDCVQIKWSQDSERLLSVVVKRPGPVNGSVHYVPYTTKGTFERGRTIFWDGKTKLILVTAFREHRVFSLIPIWIKYSYELAIHSKYQNEIDFNCYSAWLIGFSFSSSAWPTGWRKRNTK